MDRLGTSWGTVRLLSMTTSTQQEARTLIDADEPRPFAVIAETQSSGRGRLDRVWVAPPSSSILMSVALPRTAHSAALPLHVGVAVASAVRTITAEVRLKWPNDLVVERPGGLRKLGGIIAEVHADAVIVGIGLNVDMIDDELPTADAISLRQLGIAVSREALVAAILDALAGLRSDAPLDRYRELCVTIGEIVEVSRIGSEPLRGRVTGVDASGALLLTSDHAVQSITAGDVHHVRPGRAE